MKFIFSIALLKASEATVNQIVQEASAAAGLDSPSSSSSIMHTVVEMERETADMKHVSVSHAGDEVTFEISDALVIRALDMYANIAHRVCAVYMFVRPMFSMTSREMKAIEEMANERV